MMRRLFFSLIVIVGTTVVSILGLSQSNTGGPRAGEIVTPRPIRSLHWKAGQKADLAVRLQAKDKNSQASRYLGFQGIPTNKNPKAYLTFYDGESYLQGPMHVTLSHRC